NSFLQELEERVAGRGVHGLGVIDDAYPHVEAWPREQPGAQRLGLAPFARYELVYADLQAALRPAAAGGESGGDLLEVRMGASRQQAAALALEAGSVGAPGAVDVSGQPARGRSPTNALRTGEEQGAGSLTAGPQLL